MLGFSIDFAVRCRVLLLHNLPLQRLCTPFHLLITKINHKVPLVTDPARYQSRDVVIVGEGSRLVAGHSDTNHYIEAARHPCLGRQLCDTYRSTMASSEGHVPGLGCPV